MVDLVAGGERLPMERSGHEVAAIVSRQALTFLETLEGAKSAEELLAALTAKDVNDRSFANPALLTTLFVALHERRRGGDGLSVMEFPRSVPTERAGRIVAVEFGGDSVVRDAHIFMTGSDGETAFLHGAIEREVDRPVVLELSTGQIIADDLMQADGLSLSFRRVPLEGPIDLEFTTVKYC